jgi:hypothetical protein
MNNTTEIKVEFTPHELVALYEAAKDKAATSLDPASALFSATQALYYEIVDKIEPNIAKVSTMRKGLTDEGLTDDDQPVKYIWVAIEYRAKTITVCYVKPKYQHWQEDAGCVEETEIFDEAAQAFWDSELGDVIDQLFYGTEKEIKLYMPN